MEFMKSLKFILPLWLPVILTGLMGGCSSGAHSTAVHPLDLSPSATLSRPLDPSTSALAQAPTCWNTVSCCVQRNPLTPLQSCGVDPVTAARILQTLEDLEEGTQSATLKGVDMPEREEGGEGEGEGEGTPEWKKKCMALYEECQEKRWRGNCGDCFRYCEGQRGTWPFKKCRER
ncbi:MAG TPA: hypothetical protein VF815_30970 [Myxococcaceae bacterium]